MTDEEKREGITRENCLEWAILSSTPDASTQEVISKAKEYAEFILTKSRSDEKGDS